MKIAPLLTPTIRYVSPYSDEQEAALEKSRYWIDLNKEQLDWELEELYVKAAEYRQLLVRYEKLKRENTRLKKHKAKMNRFIQFLRTELTHIIGWTILEKKPLRDTELNRLHNILNGAWRQYEGR